MLLLFSVAFAPLKYRSISRDNRWPAAWDENRKHSFNWGRVAINLHQYVYFFCMCVHASYCLCALSLCFKVLDPPPPPPPPPFPSSVTGSASFSGQRGCWWIAARRAGEAQLRFHQDKGKGKLFTLTRGLSSPKHSSTDGLPLGSGKASFRKLFGLFI